MTFHARHLLLGLLALAAASTPRADPPLATCSVAGSIRSCDLWAKPGTLSLPGSSSVAAWGYSDTAAGAAQVPGPTLLALEGETVVVTLHNTLGEATSLLFPGQDLAPDTAGAASGGAATYGFPARPGTFLYQAGLLPNAQHQVAMGLYGALVVRPAAAPPAGATGLAYPSASTAFAEEAVLVLSELDPALSANPAGFDMRNFAPRYRLINGKAYPATDPVPAAAAGDRVLLRYVNAGLQHHSMALLGLEQSLIAVDGSPLSIPRRVVAESVAPGQTLDTIATVPSGAATGSRYPLYDGSLMLFNNTALGTSAGLGGMLTFVTVAGTGTPPSTGPAITSVALTPNPSIGTSAVALAATVGAGTTAAEYFIDALGASGSGVPMSVSATTASASIPAGTITALPPGAHNVYVRASNGTWGPATFAVLVLDRVGPATTGLVLAPAATGGSAVAVSATASDAATGSANVVAAELTIDGVASPSVTVTPPGTAPVASLTATLPASLVTGLAAGAHTVALRSRDALGTWGAPATATLTVDRTGTATSNLAASPNPTNGRIGLNSSTAAVRLTATLADTGSTVAGGEAFIDPAGTPAGGTGFALVPADGTFDAATEAAYGDVPLSTVVQLADGNHSLSVRGRDAAGNWGALATLTLVVDKTSPAISSLSASPNPTNAAATSNRTFTLTAAGTDALAGVAGGEWFEGADPGPGNGHPMSGAGTVTATIDFMSPTPWTLGNHTLTARVRDAAGNWSGTLATAVNVVYPDAIFADGFESGTLGAWSSATNAARLAVVATPAGFPASAGFRVLQASTGGGTGGRYLTDLSPLAETGYHARFTFHPSGSVPSTNNAATPTLLAGLNAASGTLFQVQYRRQGAAPSFTYQVRGGVQPNTGAMQFTPWVTIPATSASSIEVAWLAAATGAPRLQLTVNGTTQALSVNTSNQRLEAVRLGLVAGLAATSAGSVHLDAFVSTRRSVIGP